MNVQAKQINGIVLPTVSEMVHMKDDITVLYNLIIRCKKNSYAKTGRT